MVSNNKTPKLIKVYQKHDPKAPAKLRTEVDQKTTFSVENSTIKGQIPPFDNMGVTVSPQGTQYAHNLFADGNQPEIFGSTVAPDSAYWTYPRQLDNVQMIKQENGDVLPVIHSVPCLNQVAQLDWVSFAYGQETAHPKYADIDLDDEEAYDWLVDELNQTLYEIFGFGIDKKRATGKYHYKYSWDLQDNLGIVLAGHSNRRISVQISGLGCALAAKGWQKRLYNFLLNECERPKLNRVDLAHDDFDGKHCNVDWANLQDSIGGFWCGGRMPNVQHLGAWKRINGKGRTLTIGTRESGKYCRIYEKGKKEGDALSLWTRAEVEFKGHDRFIPFDILLNPSPYFLGAYPCFQDFDQYGDTPEKIVTVKKTASISVEKSKEIMKHQFGKYISFYRNIYSDSEIIEFLIADEQAGLPKRLQICGQFSAAVERNKQLAKAYSYTRLSQVNQRSEFSAYFS